MFLHVRVQPKASRNAIKVESQDRIKVTLTAPPVEGAANKALCRFVANFLQVPRRCVSLARGEKSRDKVLHITEVSAADVVRKLTADEGGESGRDARSR